MGGGGGGSVWVGGEGGGGCGSGEKGAKELCHSISLSEVSPGTVFCERKHRNNVKRKN